MAPSGYSGPPTKIEQAKDARISIIRANRMRNRDIVILYDLNRQVRHGRQVHFKIAKVFAWRLSRLLGVLSALAVGRRNFYREQL
jgi:hypothetical protein